MWRLPTGVDVRLPCGDKERCGTEDRRACNGTRTDGGGAPAPREHGVSAKHQARPLNVALATAGERGRCRDAVEQRDRCAGDWRCSSCCRALNGSPRGVTSCGRAPGDGPRGVDWSNAVVRPNWSKARSLRAP